MGWEWHAPSGAYRNHFLSGEIRHQAIADAHFMQFAKPEKGYGKKKGDTINITRVLNLPLATRVAETQRLPSGRPSISTTSFTVSEWGFKTEMTAFEKHLTFFNLEDEFQRALRDQITLTMDKMVADAMRVTPLVYTPVTTGATLSTTGTATGTADKNIDIADLRSLFDTMHGTYKVPAWRNGKYAIIGTTKFMRGIKNDPEYKEWIAPTSSEPLSQDVRFLKTVENFMLFETNHYDALDNTVGTGGVLGEGIAFGADPCVLAEIQTPELWTGLPEEGGRFTQGGWTAIIEAFNHWDTASIARNILISSL